nr:MAG: ORF1 [TTV-like mini virus]
MPWRYYRKRRWPYRRRFYQPRRAFRRRYYHRRRWVRKHFRKRKLKKLRLIEYQPRSIRRCNVKGLLSLFQTGRERICYNFDMYEESFVPQRLPGGGGFSLKNISLQSLYIEHTHGHNIFTHTNEPYPLMRYTGCTLKFYQSANVDYIVTYSTTWPLKSNLKMYNSMQPQIHYLQKNRIIVPSKITKPNKRKNYKKVFIPPPTQMKNQWYFQSNLANIPLIMLRTSSTSLDHWHIGTREQSTNITIISLNTGIFQNRNWGQEATEYFSQYYGTQKVYLYTSRSTDEHSKIKAKTLIYLGNTKHNTPGLSFEDAKKAQASITTQQWAGYKYWGNPFYYDYLINEPMYASTITVGTLANKIQNKEETTLGEITDYTFTKIEPLINFRYNPYKDNGVNNECYFLSAKQQGGTSWDPPSNPDLTNEHLPLWLLLFGFSDFQKKIGKLQHIDTEQIFVIKTQFTDPKRSFIVPISASFTEGHSPYENTNNPIDDNRWYPCFQFQQEAYTNICLSGPGTPKIPPGDTVEAKMHYSFHFKWGGELPDMSLIQNPSEQPTYVIPNNFISTTSLQNPTTAPEQYLYRFDERRGILTKKAAKRICKDWQTEKYSFPSTEPRFSETPQTQTQEETTSEESETEDLFQQLEHQRSKQQRLKHRIKSILHKIQNTE